MCRFGEESPDTAGQDAARGASQVRAPRFKARRRTVSQKIKPPSWISGSNLNFGKVRVKRWSKSPPRHQQWWRHEKPLPVQGKIGGWTARPIAAGMPHPSLHARSRASGGGQVRRKVGLREMTTEAPTCRGGTESGLPAPKLIFPSARVQTRRQVNDRRDAVFRAAELQSCCFNIIFAWCLLKSCFSNNPIANTLHSDGRFRRPTDEISLRLQILPLGRGHYERHQVLRADSVSYGA